MKIARSWTAGLVLLLLVQAAAAQPAGDARGLSVHDLARLQNVVEIAASPDGRRVAYTVLVPHDPLEANALPALHLYVADLEADSTRPLLTDSIQVNRIAWTPDGRISFTAAREGDAHAMLYALAPDGGAPQPVFEAARAVGAYAWHPEGTQVAFLAEEAKPEEQAGTQGALPYQPIVYEEDVPHRKVYVVDVEGDATARMLEHEGTAYAVHWSPQGDRLAAVIAPTPLVDDFYMQKRVRLLDPATGTVTARIDNPGKLGEIAWSPDGTHLALISGVDRHDPLEGRLMIARAEDGAKLRDVLPDLEGHVEAVAWRDAETLRYLASVGVESRYGEVGIDGGASQTLFTGEGMHVARFSPAGEQTALRIDTPGHPAELYVLAEGDEKPERLTNVNPWLADVALAEQEVVRYQARDGLEIEGLLIRPLGYEEGQRHPLLLVVHGGPEAHYDNGWLSDYARLGQVAAAEGMAVFYPNYRGSTGRGVDFSTTSQADAAGKEFDDLVDGVDHLIETGLVDSARVGVTGGSYGGYATGWLSTRYSDRFAAGVMFVGISNKVSKVGTTDIPNEEYLVHARKRVWDDWDFFLERSPIYYADQAQTPLLILHGAEDPRVDPGQSKELYRHVKLRGEAPVRLILYPGEGHGNRHATARFDYSLRALRWLEHYLQGSGGAPPPPTLDVPAQVSAAEPGE